MEQCRRMKMPQLMSKIGYILDNESPRGYASSFKRSESFATKTDILTNGSTFKNHISLKKVFEYSVTRRTSFPIMVLGVSASSSSSSHSSTSMTLSRQEIDHPTSSSSSCTSPTMTSSTVSSDSVIRRARRDLCGIDSFPVTVSSKHVERKERGDLLTKPNKNPEPNKNEDHDLERGDLLNFDIPEWLQEFKENLVNDRVPEHRDSHASSSREPSLEPTPATSVDLDKNTVFVVTSIKIEIARSARGPKLQGPVQKTHWWSRTSCRKLW